MAKWSKKRMRLLPRKSERSNIKFYLIVSIYFKLFYYFQGKSQYLKSFMKRTLRPVTNHEKNECNWEILIIFRTEFLIYFVSFFL
jgi:hypothetical protein